MASLTYVGGTETYTENETRNVEVSMEDRNDVLTVDRQDELWNYKYYYENSSVGNSEPYKNRFSNSSGNGMSYIGRSHISSRIGTIITTKITFLKAIPNVKISKITWRDCIDYFKNDTTLETDIIKLNDNEIYTITATKEQYGTSALTKYTVIARDITIGNISAGDVLSFETKKEGTIDSTSLYNDLVEGLTFFFSSDPITLTETVPVQKTRSINKPVSSIYAGVTATVPVYTETTTTEDVVLSANTFTDFFSASNTGTTGTNAKGITWADNSGGGLKLTFGNYGIDSSTSMTTFTAQRDLTNVVIKGLYYTESNYDKITLTVAGTTVLNAVSGTSSTLTQRWTGSLSKGQTIVLKYVKDSSNSATNESSTYFTLSCDPYQKTMITQTQTGTETKLVDKKIVKGYIGGPNGKARLFFGENKPFSYTGEYTEQDYTDSSGIAHKIYTLTTSGQLKITKEAGYWMCGGGSGGGAGHGSKVNYTTYYYSGRGGGGGHVSSGTLADGTWQVQIGAGGEEVAAEAAYYDTGDATSITGTETYTAAGGGNPNGGSGGGGNSHYNSSDGEQAGGTGDGISTIPFALNELQQHCAGGGGGGTYGTAYSISGGNGGSNGTNGSSKSSTSGKGGSGGTYGGGDGGGRGPYSVGDGKTSILTRASSAGLFYGAGGGGGYVVRLSSSSNMTFGKGSAGYQGVVYIAIPPITTT